MGLLDEAIREHLELKRQHGANEDELARQEAEALGPVSEEEIVGEGGGAAAPAGDSEAGWPFDRDFSDAWAHPPDEPALEWTDGTAEEVDVPSFIPPDPVSDASAEESAVADAPTSSFDVVAHGHGDDELGPESPEEDASPEEVGGLEPEEDDLASSGPETEFLPPPTPEPPAAEPPAAEAPAAEPPDDSGAPEPRSTFVDAEAHEPRAVEPQSVEPEPVEPQSVEPEPAGVEALEGETEDAAEIEQDPELPPEREPAVLEPTPGAEEPPPAVEPPLPVVEEQPLREEPPPLAGDVAAEPSVEAAPGQAPEPGEPLVGSDEALGSEAGPDEALGSGGGPDTQVWSLEDDPGLADEPGLDDEPGLAEAPVAEGFAPPPVPDAGDDAWADERFEEPLDEGLAPPVGPSADAEPIDAELDEAARRDPPPVARGFFEETEEHETLWHEERPDADPDFEN